MMADKVISRFAPSPTGFLHIGGVRTALFSWLYSKSLGGQCLLRLEDTDKDRSEQKFTDSIIDGFQWLKIHFDGEPIYQSQNLEKHLEKVGFLLDTNKAYYCDCSTDRLQQLREEQKKNGLKPKYDGKCRELNLRSSSNHVVRFKNPKSGVVVFEDIVRGGIEVANEELDDLILVRRNGSPTYNLSVVVDDINMGITHVIRGDDHINNTPRQINIFEALSADIPKYGHVPMILGKDGKRMSKRHGAVSVFEYKDMGVLSEALLNYLVRLGWSSGDQEFFSMGELLEKFKEGKMNTSPASFSINKLLWYNKEYISRLDNKSLITKLSDYASNFQDDLKSPEILDLIKDRCSLLTDFKENSGYFFEDFDEIDTSLTSKVFNKEGIEILQILVDELVKIKDWNAEKIHSAIEVVMSTYNVSLGHIGKPFRLSITGKMNSPSIDKTAAVLGKEKVIFRIKQAIKDFS